MINLRMQQFEGSITHDDACVVKKVDAFSFWSYSKLSIVAGNYAVKAKERAKSESWNTARHPLERMMMTAESSDLHL